jgi:hypothetical protein
MAALGGERTFEARERAATTSIPARFRSWGYDRGRKAYLVPYKYEWSCQRSVQVMMKGIIVNRDDDVGGLFVGKQFLIRDRVGNLAPGPLGPPIVVHACR